MYRSRELVTTQIDEGTLQRVIEATIEANASRSTAVGLRTFEEIAHFADRVCRSNLCPKDFKGKPEDAIIAVMMGNELGLPPMASLQSIAVINGRPCVWGDAVPGLCMQTGRVQDVQERFEGEAGTESFSAVCIVTRRGMSPREGRFSAGDVRQAGLKATHMMYPKDMMMWRARHRAWHGAFPDTLKGLGTAEIEREEGALSDWPMPAPEKSWHTTNVPTDGHDMTWLNSFASQLAGEPNAWKWMELLVEGLASAPTVRDVEEVAALPMVVNVTGKAPAEAKAAIELAFANAKGRLTPNKPAKKRQAEVPAAPNAPTEDVATAAAPPPEVAAAVTVSGGDGPTFEEWLLDENGEPIGDEPFTDPMLFVSRLEVIWQVAPDVREKLMQENASALEAAASISEKAADIIGTMRSAAPATEDAAEDAAPPAVAIVPRTTDGQYLKDFRPAAAATTADTYLDFIAANQETMLTTAMSTRSLLLKALVEQADKLGIPKPAGLAEMMQAKPQTQQQPARRRQPRIPTSPAMQRPSTTDR